jgi:hypothetical protein
MTDTTPTPDTTTGSGSNATDAETTRVPRTAASPVGGGIAVAATVLAVLAVGVAAGIGGPTAVLALGAPLLWLGLRWHRDDSGLRDWVAAALNDTDPSQESDALSQDDRSDESAVAVRRHTAVVTSLSAVTAGLTFGGAVTAFTAPVAYVLMFVGGLAESLTVTLGAVAVAASVLEASVGTTGADRGVPDGLLSRATNPVLGATVAGVTLLAVVVALGAVGLAAGRWLFAGGAVSPFPLVVVLQIGVVALALLLPRVERALEDLLGPDRYESPAVADWLGRTPDEIPATYWAVLTVQVAAVWGGFVFVSWPTAGLGGLLATAFGVVLPLALTAVVGLALAVVGGWALQRFVVVASGTDGPAAVRTVAAVPPLVGGVWLIVTQLPFTAGTVTAIAVPLGVAIAVTGFGVGTHALSAAAHLGPFSDRAAGFGVAASLVVSLALTTALTGGAPVAVYLAVAAALATWYSGELAAGLGRGLGRGADTTAGEAAHAAALGLVLLATVVVVTGLTYFAGVPRGLFAGARPAAAVVFLAVAVLAVAARETVTRSRS